MIDNKEQFGFPGLDVQGITVHNTGNALSAVENYAWMEQTKTSQGCHFFVDEYNVIQAMPTSWCVWHTGKANDWACKHTIAIEICRSRSDEELYLKAEKRAVALIETLMTEYNLTPSEIYFHQDFNKTTYCPHRILDKYGSKKNWKARYF